MCRPARASIALALTAVLVGFASVSARAETGTFTCAVKEGVEVQRDGCAPQLVGLGHRFQIWGSAPPTLT